MIRRRDLRFQKGKGFKIVQFTDLHLSDPVQDARTLEVMANVLAAEPDTALVVLSGDIISGWEWDKQTKGWAEERWRRLVQPLVAAGKPYAIVLGNHDREADLSPREVITLDQQCSELSLSQHGVADACGSGNYWLSILPSDGGAAEATRLWFLDSVPTPWYWTLLSGQSANDVQLRWVVREGTYALNRGVQQLAFVHVPLPEYISLWNTQSTVGMKGEAVCCRGYHRGLFGAFKQAGVSAVYCGHDHLNDYLGTMDGVRLAYGQKTGVAGYGEPCGARVVVLQEGEDPAQSTTYIRMADGSRQDQTPSAKSWWSRLQIIGNS